MKPKVQILRIGDDDIPNVHDILTEIMMIFEVWGYKWNNRNLHVFADMKEWVYPYPVPSNCDDWDAWSKGLQGFIKNMIESHCAFLATDEGNVWKARHERRLKKMKLERLERLEKLQLEWEQRERERLEQTPYTKEVSATDENGDYY